MRQSIITRWQGRDVTLTVIAMDSGIDPQLIRYRYAQGKRGVELTMPVRAMKRKPRIVERSSGLM